MTTLRDQLIRRIGHDGPITVADYMAEALGHPEFGYYMKGDPLGRAGDFITAPEISQIYGELLGLWCAVTWQQLGNPSPVQLVELGPGRGTLMADTLRAIAGVPAFPDSIRVCLVETSPALRRRQEAALRDFGVPVHWVTQVTEIPKDPVLLIASEFFDALPIRQFIRTGDGWAERGVNYDAATEQFNFELFPADSACDVHIPAALRHHAAIGSLVEVSSAAVECMKCVARHISRHGGAALVFDYGYAESAAGETLQAVKGHTYHDVLDAPGDADLTAHVDFASLRHAAEAAGVNSCGPVAQAAFLGRIGIAARAESLAAQHPARATEILAGARRLTDPSEMGSLFKCLAITGRGQPTPAGFEQIEA